MKLFKKFLQYAVGNGLVFIVGLVSTPLITRLIMPEEMGKFSMFNSAVNLIIIFGLVGLDQSFVRYFYEEEETSRAVLLKRVTNIALLIGLVVCGGIVLFQKSVSEFLVGEWSTVFIICLIGYLLFSILNKFAVLNIRMQQRAVLYSVANTVLKLTYLIFAVLLYVKLGNQYITLVAASTLSMIVTTLLAVAFDYKSWFAKNKSKIKVTTKELLTYGFPFIFSMSLTWVFQTADKLFIREICGYTELGLYSGAMNIVTILNTCQAMFTTFWVPVAYERLTIDPDAKKFYVKINEIVTVVMMILAIGMIACKDLIILLLGSQYKEAVYIFPYLVFMPIMYTISETTVMGINFSKKTMYHIYVGLISAVANIIGNAILVPFFGAVGAAISTGLSYIVFFAVRTYFSKKFYPVEYPIKKIAFATVCVYIVALYASFNSFNIVIVGLSLGAAAIICLLYRGLIVQGYAFIKEKLDKRKA